MATLIRDGQSKFGIATTRLERGGLLETEKQIQLALLLSITTEEAFLSDWMLPDHAIINCAVDGSDTQV